MSIIIMIIMMVQVYFRLFFSKWPSTIILHFHQPSSSENKQAEAWLNVVEQNKRAIFITQHSSKKEKNYHHHRRPPQTKHMHIWENYRWPWDFNWKTKNKFFQRKNLYNYTPMTINERSWWYTAACEATARRCWLI